ncbi:hypothetical protein NCC49_001001 [Naganishia albida]|nr:hypothetical protein NCC49_001001 [Naganishia albida]
MYDPPSTIIYDATDPIGCSADIYVPTCAPHRPRDVVVFIHGGAWRTGDKSDHADIPTLLAHHHHARGGTALLPLPTIIVPNYRLSAHPDHPTRAAVLHPTHIHDVARCLAYLVRDWRAWPEVRNVVLVGHSCGAHILSHLVCGNIPAAAAAAVDELVGRTTALGFLDGIYSLRALIAEYPAYRFFVEAAFGADPRAIWEAGDVFVPGEESSSSPRRLPEHVQRIVVAHATEDELLTPAQGKLWLAYLRHVGLGRVVEWDQTTLRGTHDGCLHNDSLAELLCKLLE